MNALTPATLQPAPVRRTALPLLRVVVAGHVDHGKSTLIGRLIHDTGSLADGKLEAIKAVSARRGMPFEWAFLLDALQAERDQGITIDTSQIGFRTPQRDVVLIDAPGHVEFLQNMVTGAAQADAALLVIDCAEGVREQSHRHAMLLSLLGIKQVAVIVNKMDKAVYSEAVFRGIEAGFTSYLRSLDISPVAFVPVAAREGAMIAARGESLSWYRGPTVVEVIDNLRAAQPPRDLPARFVVQDVYKFDDRRIVAGHLESGRLSIGDELVFVPSGKLGRVRSIETWPQPAAGSEPSTLLAGSAAAITLEREIYIERGEVAAPVLARPPAARVLKARIFWFNETPLQTGSRLTLKLGTAATQAEVASIEAVVDSSSLQRAQQREVERNQIAELTLGLAQPAAADNHALFPQLGRFVLQLGGRICGGGVVIGQSEVPRRKESPNVTAVASAVTEAERIARTRHWGAVVWLTGLPSSGKSTIGRALERVLFEQGAIAVLLDGDTLRTGLNSDLGFSGADRSENVRRAAELASFLARQGQIAIVALVSPNAADRLRAREIGGAPFFEVHVHASVATCAARDPKGLYAKAKAGEVVGFTGVSAPYDVPERPDVLLETDRLALAECISRLVQHLENADILKAGSRTIGPMI
jgi:bifunctional enzyme CysN/CysC